MVKVGMYIRVSTEDQAHEGHSLDEQETRLNNNEPDINAHIIN